MDDAFTTLTGSARKRPENVDDLGPADPGERTTVTIVMRPATSGSTAHLAPRVADREYLSREEFAKHRAASVNAIYAVERFAKDAGLSIVETSAPRRSVIVEGTVAQFTSLFRTELRRYRHASGEFRGRTGELQIPSALADVISGVFGLDERPQARTQFRIAQPGAVEASFNPPQLGELYGFPANATGSGQTIALIELGGGYKTADLTAYFSSLGVTEPKITMVGVDGGTNTPSGTADSADGEVDLDIEVAGSLATGADVVVYFAPNTDQGFLDAITTAIHDTTNKPSIISISWGSAESDWTQQAMTNFDAAFADAATLGITVCVAAGDNGSADGVTDGKAHVDFPASSPHALACGGTTLKANGTNIASETVWNATGDGATGGGISDVFPVPAWQANANVPPSSNTGGRVGRGIPDVCGDADPATGYNVRVDGSTTVFGGTSAVAPLWAALIARLNQLAPKPLGLVNPLLYANPSVLRDITSGSNGSYTAAPGWDACSGLGSPNGEKLTALVS